MNRVILLVFLGFMVIFSSFTGKATETNINHNINYDEFKITRVSGVGRIPYQEVGQLIGEVGQSKDDFAKSVSLILTDFSEKTGFEACGYIATDGDRYGILITSSRSHVACVNYARSVPEGMFAIDQTIHSHSPVDRARPNHADRTLMGHELSVVGGGMRQPTSVLNKQKIDMFSDMDIRSGPGYLAIPNGRAIHHNGKVDSIREVN